MSKVDEELSRRFHRAERPLRSDDLFEELARRRDRRRALKRVQAGALAAVVLAATAAGFLALDAAFDQDKRDVGHTPLAANGEIVFSRMGDDGRFHLYAAQPDGSGVRQITHDASNDTDPAVSPDGATIAYAHELDEGLPVVATVPFGSGIVTWQTGGNQAVNDPSWSPDGRQIAFVGSTIDTADLYVIGVNGGETRRIPFSADENDVTPTGYSDFPAHPTWSPAGTRLAVAVHTSGGTFSTSWDLAVVKPDGTGLEWLAATDEVDEEAPAWSPDGTRIAFLRPGEGGHEIRTIAPDGSDETLIARAIEATLEPDIAWAPDGSALLVSDGDWIYRVDAMPTGDPDSNFVQLVRGVSPSWQPLPSPESSATTSPEPSFSPSPEPEGKDVGLGFNLCHTERLGGIDFLGDGTNGTAWTGTKVRPDGTCPDAYDDPYGVAADFTGDGIVDSWSGESIVACNGCEPISAMDLNGDGGDELLVVLDYFSIMHYGVYTIRPVDGEQQVRTFRTGPPGHPGHPDYGLEEGAAFDLWVGGDAGSANWIYCDTLPELWLTATESPVDGGAGDETTVYETHVSLGTDGIAHILSYDTYTVPADVQPELRYAGPDHSQPDCGLGVNDGRP